MLQKLKRKLVLICLLCTTTLITLITLVALNVSTNQINLNNEISLEKHLFTISEHLQTGIISHSWLAQFETNNHLIIDISSNEVSLDFPGSYLTGELRRDLIAQVYDLIKSYNPSGSGELIFNTYSHNVHYLCLSTSMTCGGSRYRIKLIQDMTLPDKQIFRLKVIFISLIILGTILLGIFSFWFVSKAIKPVEVSQKEQTAFIAAASHELRSPLNVIQTTTDAALMNEENGTHPFEIISSECHQLSRLIDDLLFLARSDAKHWNVNLSPTEIDTLLLDFYECMQPVVESQKHHLTIDLPDDALPMVSVDKERIIQVLSILINNAITYTPDFSTIHLSIELGDLYLHLITSDNGPGIPDESKAHVFKRFYRLDTSRHDTNHCGLGLSIASEIATLHHGHLSLKDTEGGGATFILELPISAF